MPTYDYRCRDCGREFELFQRMSDAPTSSCSLCGGDARRLISAGAGLLFKGDGFYITDYRPEEYKKRAKEDSGGDKSGDGAAPKSADGGGGDAKSRSSGDGASASAPAKRSVGASSGEARGGKSGGSDGTAASGGEG